jgi:Na+-driven multidrug efflux pump
MFVIAIPVVYLLVRVFDLGMYGVWTGVITGNVLSGLISLVWARTALTRLSAGTLKVARAATAR